LYRRHEAIIANLSKITAMKDINISEVLVKTLVATTTLFGAFYAGRFVFPGIISVAGSIMHFIAEAMTGMFTPY
jgi:hypothetical protein